MQVKLNLLPREVEGLLEVINQWDREGFNFPVGVSPATIDHLRLHLRLATDDD